MRYVFVPTCDWDPEMYAIYDQDNNQLAEMSVGDGKITVEFEDGRSFVCELCEGDIRHGFDDEVQRFNFMESIDNFIFRMLTKGEEYDW